MRWLLIVLMCSGCSEFETTKYKCHDGVLYLKNSGAWIEAKIYSQNKCLPDGEVEK